MSPNGEKDYASSHHIDDIRNLDMMIVDSIYKANEVQNEILRMSKQKEYGEVYDFDAFNYLFKWVRGDVPKEDKDRFFSAYSSHELHLYLHRYDPEYFKEVV